MSSLDTSGQNQPIANVPPRTIESNGAAGLSSYNRTPVFLSSEALPDGRGYVDTYFEKRFEYPEHFSLEKQKKELANILTFLSKTFQVDEFYDCPKGFEGLPPGLYRIREEGGSAPLLTVKEKNNKPGTASTLDFIFPDPDLVKRLKKTGHLLAIVEKTRITYRSRKLPDCLFHHDSVHGLGDFIDVKADSDFNMRAFLNLLGLDPQLAVGKSYLTMKQERGVNSKQLKMWRFHQKFEDYILGVVSGTLTPLSFLISTLASGGAKSLMLINLMIAGIGDGIADSVAAVQSRKSKGEISFLKQVGLFMQTMSGKAIIPMTFVPIILLGNSNLAIGIATAFWAGVLLSSTAYIQAVAKENSVKKAVIQLLSWGAIATAAGTVIGKLLPLLKKITDQ